MVISTLEADIAPAASNKAESEAGTRAFMACHFLRIPIEIRLEIYRYLLLPRPKIRASIPPRLRTSIAHSTDHEESFEGSSADEWTDESDSDSDSDSLISEMIEAILTLRPADIFCLAKEPFDLEFGRPGGMTWKHSPLKGIGKEYESGMVFYATAQLQGDVEPHILAKFQRILLDAHFDESDTGSLELWIDDDTHIIREDDATEFKNLLNSSSIFKDLVKILSNPPCITHFEIQLEVKVIATSNLIIEAEDLDDILGEGDEEDQEMEIKVDRIIEIANFKATELFLDSKIMKPLLKLKNVANCSFKFGFQDFPEEEGYKPPTKYVKVLERMKDKIEGNYRELKAA
ncbi:hypothetical protein D0Z07_6714 [Hyphodiscus hymeniophilus]|uniref:Uncharacterized protein n=1 Tax=Hyphodiscus hymeniophilus TaxID=353542 RepID=A0A9P6VGT5_9HELO|nr:hypothetical protein D0Z07_6714 [Hyphodiscus hymeniophilus]